MSVDPEIHYVNAEEIVQVSQLGFQFNPIKEKAPEEFINVKFPGIRLLVFIREIEKLLAPLTESIINKHIQQNIGPPPTLRILYYSDDYKDPESGLLFSRTFVKEINELSVVHDYLILPEISRGKGIAKKVLAACLTEYLNMGVSKIRVHAGLQDGGYVWAKAGFKANNKKEVIVILNTAKQRLSADQYRIVKTWYDDHYNNNSPDTAFNIEEWARLGYMKDILKGSDWHGEIDLTNPEEITNFNNYVSR